MLYKGLNQSKIVQKQQSQLLRNRYYIYTYMYIYLIIIYICIYIFNYYIREEGSNGVLFRNAYFAPLPFLNTKGMSNSKSTLKENYRKLIYNAHSQIT